MFHFVPGARSENPRGKCWWCCIPWDGGKPQTLGFFTPLLEPFKRGWIWDPRDIPTSKARRGSILRVFFLSRTPMHLVASHRLRGRLPSLERCRKLTCYRTKGQGPGNQKTQEDLVWLMFVLMFLRDSKQVNFSSSSCSFFFAPFSSGVLIGMKAAS